MGPAMLLHYETEIAYRRETMLRTFARTRRAPRPARTAVRQGPVTLLHRSARGRTATTVARQV